MLKSAFIKKQSGVSLIEILVTTLVLGVGLLGVAALQISGVNSNLEGFYTSQATAIAEELATKIRSSKVVTMIPTSNGRTNVDYGTYLTNYSTTKAAVSCASLPTLCRSNGAVPAVCTMADMANFDLEEACWAAEQTLPGDPTVRTDLNGNRLTIVIDWASTAARQDFGETASVVNSGCAAITGSSTRNCVLMELVP